MASSRAFYRGKRGRQGDSFSHLVAVEIPRGRIGRPFTVQNVTIWHVWLPGAVIGDIIQFVRAEQCINITPTYLLHGYMDIRCVTWLRFYR
jgi:hypothetical protein